MRGPQIAEGGVRGRTAPMRKTAGYGVEVLIHWPLY